MPLRAGRRAGERIVVNRPLTQSWPAKPDERDRNRTTACNAQALEHLVVDRVQSKEAGTFGFGRHARVRQP